MEKKEGFIKWFSELKKQDLAIAGVKGAYLAEMYNNKLPVPPGFVVTSNAFRYFIEKNNLRKLIDSILNETSINNAAALENNSSKIRKLIENSSIPNELEEEIIAAYENLNVKEEDIIEKSKDVQSILEPGHEPLSVAVRSSGITKGREAENYHGKLVSFLNVRGEENLLNSVKSAFASFFDNSAIIYRRENDLPEEKSAVAVIVQKMVNANKSGVVFSRNPIKRDDNIVIKAIFGFREEISSKKTEPDIYTINQDLSLIGSKISYKEDVLTGHEIKMLAQFARRLEEDYGKPQDMEFAIDEKNMFIVQAMPIIFEEREELTEDVEEEPREAAKEEKGEMEKLKEEIQESSESVPDIDEEELILKSLEGEKEYANDEYDPGLFMKKKADIPVLNDAIPVESEDLNEKEEETLELKIEKKDDNLESIKSLFEEKIENILDKEVIQEAEEYEEYKKEQEKLKKEDSGDSGNSGNEQVMDIF